MPLLRTRALALVKETYGSFQSHKSPWLAAAIAYFTMFAIAPLILVVVEIVGLLLGHHRAAAETLYTYLQRDAGTQASSAVRSIVNASLHHRRAGVVAEITGWAVFAFAAVGFFASIQEALNTVWDVVPAKRGILQTIFERLGSFAVLLGIALLLVIAIAVNALLTVAGNGLAHVFPLFPTLLKIVDFILSAAVITTGFAILFEFLPECRIELKDVWLGAFLTAVLFVIGQFLLGWYLGRAGVTSSFGAFGSLVVLLLWVNYTAQIVLFGAEFTHVYAKSRSSAEAQS